MRAITVLPKAVPKATIMAQRPTSAGTDTKEPCWWASRVLR